MTVATHEVAWFGRACTGESLSGDAAVVVEQGDDVFLAILDGLGHGSGAQAVARVAVPVLKSLAQRDVGAAILRLHEALRGTLGAVAGLCWYEGATGNVRWVGVGNVVLKTFGSVEARLAGRDGLLGQVFPSPRVETLRLQPGDLLVLLTDGIRERLSAAEYPGLLGDSAVFVARRVVTQFGREHDDATCIALRRGR